MALLYLLAGASPGRAAWLSVVDRCADGAAVGERRRRTSRSARAWLVDPAAGREGPGEIVVATAILESVTWLDGAEARRDRRPTASSSRPGSSTSTPTSASPATRTPRRSPPGSAAAAHGGFTTVCAMPNTTPAARRARRSSPASEAAAGASGLAGRAARLRRRDRRTRRARRWRRSASWPTPAPSASPTTARRSVGGRSCATRCSTPGCSGCRSSTTPRTASLTAGAEANEGFVATVLGLQGLAGRGRGGGRRARPRDPRRRPPRRPGRAAAPDAPLDRGRARPRPAGEGGGPAGDLRRHAAPPRPDRRVARRRAALGVGGERRPGAARPVRADRSRPPYATSLRVNPPLRAPADAAAVPGRPRRRHRGRGRDGPRAAHPGRQGRRVRAGANGISGIETALGVAPGGGRRRAAARSRGRSRR